MENFIFNDEFYDDVEHFVTSYFESVQEIKDLPDDWRITCFKSVLEPVFQLDADWILDRIDDERWSDNNSEYDEILKILSEADFSKINAAIPKLYYENAEAFSLTKQDLIIAV